MQCNIRLLGGLISAHLLAKDYISQLKDRLYHDQLLHLAISLGNRLLPAFETPTGLPYAWINLKVRFTNLWLSSYLNILIVLCFL
jgi:ER degradation enhancer, mannosidase alpha-like 1